MVEAVRGLARALAIARDTLRDYHTKFLPPKVEQYLKAAENAATPGNAKSNINFFVLGLFGAQRARVFLDEFEIMAPWFPQTDQKFVAAARARIAVVEARVAAAKEQVAVKNVPPVDGYRGADKEALRTTIAQAWRTVNNNNFVPLRSSCRTRPGVASLLPSQLSARSQPPATATRQTVCAALRASGGLAVCTPSQISAWSQPSAASRHTSFANRS